MLLNCFSIDLLDLTAWGRVDNFKLQHHNNLLLQGLCVSQNVFKITQRNQIMEFIKPTDIRVVSISSSNAPPESK